MRERENGMVEKTTQREKAEEITPQSQRIYVYTLLALRPCEYHTHCYVRTAETHAQRPAMIYA